MKTKPKLKGKRILPTAHIEIKCREELCSVTYDSFAKLPQKTGEAIKELLKMLLGELSAK